MAVTSFSIGKEFTYKEIKYKVIARESADKIYAKDISGYTYSFEISKMLPELGTNLFVRDSDAQKENKAYTNDLNDPIIRKKYSTIKDVLHVKSKNILIEHAKAKGISVATIYRRLKAYDREKLRGFASKDKNKGRRPDLGKREPIVQQVIDKRYPDPLQPTDTEICEEIQEICHDAGLKPPCFNSIHNRLEERRAQKRKEDLLTRYGQKEYEKQCCGTGGEVILLRSLQNVEIDHHQLDVFAADDTRKRALGRPWLTLIIDNYSRAILGFYLTLEKPSYVSVMMALRNSIWIKQDICVKHKLDSSEWPIYGYPETINTDNGKEFQSDAFETACNHCDIAIQYRPTYTARYGGKIERSFRTLIFKVINKLKGKTFSNPKARGEYDSQAEAAFTLDEIERFILKHIIIYLNHPQRRLRTTPLLKWNEGFGMGAIRIPDSQDELMQFLLKEETRIVQDSAINFHTIEYWDFILEEQKLIGKTVLVHFDPRCLLTIYVENPITKKYIAVKAKPSFENTANHSLSEIKEIRGLENAEINKLKESPENMRRRKDLRQDIDITGELAEKIKRTPIKTTGNTKNPFVCKQSIKADDILKDYIPTSKLVPMDEVPLLN